MGEETATETATATEDMVTAVVTATAALTVVMVTVTVVAMAVVAAAAVEDVLFNMDMEMDIKRETITICVSRVFHAPKEVLLSRSCSTRKESCVFVPVLFVYEVHSFSPRTSLPRLHPKFIIHNKKVRGDMNRKERKELLC